MGMVTRGFGLDVVVVFGGEEMKGSGKRECSPESRCSRSCWRFGAELLPLGNKYKTTWDGLALYQPVCIRVEMEDGKDFVFPSL